MQVLRISDSHLARLTNLCFECAAEADLSFVGARLFPGILEAFSPEPQRTERAATLLCGAFLPEDLSRHALLEFPLLSDDGLTLGLFVIPDQLTPGTQESVKHYVDLATLIVRELLCAGAESLTRDPDRCSMPTLSAQIFGMSVEMFCIASIDGHFKRVNSAFVEELGYELNELLAQSILSLVHPDDRSATVTAAKTLAAEGSLKRFRNRYRCRNGNYVWLEWSCVLEQSDGLVYGIARNITEQIDAEQSVRSSNELLRTVSQTLMNFISLKESANPFDTMLEELLRMTASKYGFVGEVIYEDSGVPYLKSHALTNIAWSEETRNFYAAHAETGMEFRNLNTLFGQVMVTGRPVVSNSPATDPRAGGLPKGHPALNAFLGMPIYSGSALIGMIGLANRPGGYDEKLMSSLELFLSTCSNLILAFRAERARQNAERLLEAEELKRRTIVEAALDGILTINVNGHIDSCNLAVGEIFGYAPQEMTGRPLHMLFAREARDSLSEFIKNAVMDTEQRFRGEIDGVHCDGKSKPLDIALSAAKFAEEVMIVGVIRDVSLIHDAKRELIEARIAAEAANAAKSAFVAHMSHELRTPITGVIGMTELALETELSELQRDYLSTALDSSESLLFLVNDILDFSKIEAGQLVLESTTFDLRQILEMPLKEMSERAARKQLEFLASIDEKLPPLLIGDPMRLRQVLLNLMGNAIKFTDHGQVTLNVVVLATAPDAILVRFEVADSGIGISNLHQQKIFSAFAQADASISRKFGGTGLGLSISANLVEKMGGKIAVASTLGEGSSFHFDLRFATAQTSQRIRMNLATTSSDVSIRQTAYAQPPLKVLLAEDNLVNQKVVSTLLASKGHNVQVACNGQEAIEMARNTPFDIILMDLEMPVMDGVEAARVIRAEESGTGRRVPIMALTAHAVQGVSQICSEAGMDGHLSKPLKSREIVAAVEKMATLQRPPA